jgi:chromosome segregation ATPase
VAPFGLFKKKEKDEEPAQVPTLSQPPGSSLSVQQAQSLLQEIETSNLQALAGKLTPIKISAEQSLKAIGTLASDMEHEKIKLEGLEQRFKSLVENSRKTIIVTLKREASTGLELPQSVNDVRKFKEKLEGMMKRLGEVSGSHSKILNNFMKKNASRMKAEFETLEELLGQTKSIVSDYDQSRNPIVKCSAALNTLSQKTASIKSGEIELESAHKAIDGLQEEIMRMNTEIESLRNSAEFHDAEATARQFEDTKARREAMQNKMLELFSHVSRAFTKYSYGVSKETEGRLSLMSSEPWKLLVLPDVSAYTDLLAQVRKSISSGQIQLKDSEKMISYIDTITQSLPEFQTEARRLDLELGTLGNLNISLLDRVERLGQEIIESTDRLSRSKEHLEVLRRQNEEKKGEVRTLLSEVSDQISSISGQKYVVEG